MSTSQQLTSPSPTSSLWVARTRNTRSSLLRQIIRKRASLILLLLTLSLIVTFTVAYSVSPVYEATTVIEVNSTPPADDLAPHQANHGRALSTNVARYTALLHSQILAQQVINSLDLRSDQLRQQDILFDLFIPRIIEHFPLLDTTLKQDESSAALVPTLLASIQITPSPGTELIRISVKNQNADLAARIANAAAAAATDLALQQRFRTTEKTKEFLSKRIFDAQAALSEAERNLLNYQKAHKIVDLDQRLQFLNERISGLNRAYIEAESERIGAASQVQGLATASENDALHLSESALTQELKAKRAALAAEYREKQRIYKPDYPKMVRLSERIAELDQSLQDEVTRTGRVVESQYRIRSIELTKLQDTIDQLTDQVLLTREQGSELRRLENDVEIQRGQYKGLIQRLQELSTLAGISRAPLTILDPALPPGSPVQVLPLRSNLIALAIGLITSLLIALVIERRDRSLRNIEDIEEQSQLPVLATIPWAPRIGILNLGRNPALLVAQRPDSPIAETFRSLRTFLTLKRDPQSAQGQRIQLVGIGKTQGTSTCAVGVALAMAENGAKVLLVDANLRHPTLHKKLKVPNETGLSDLATEQGASEFIQETRFPRLRIATCGRPATNAVGILASPGFSQWLEQISRQYDHVVLDSPPGNQYADALILSDLCDCSILAVDLSTATTDHLAATLRNLNGVGANLAGSIVFSSSSLSDAKFA